MQLGVKHYTSVMLQFYYKYQRNNYNQIEEHKQKELLRHVLSTVVLLLLNIYITLLCFRQEIFGNLHPYRIQCRFGNCSTLVNKNATFNHPSFLFLLDQEKISVLPMNKCHVSYETQNYLWKLIILRISKIYNRCRKESAST